MVIQSAPERIPCNNSIPLNNPYPCDLDTSHHVNPDNSPQGKSESEFCEPDPTLKSETTDTHSLTDSDSANLLEINDVHTLKDLIGAADPSITSASMEQPFYSAQREHPPFVCPKPDCNTCKNGQDYDGCRDTNSFQENYGPGSFHADPAAPTRSMADFPDTYWDDYTDNPGQSEQLVAREGEKTLYSRALGRDYVTYPGSLPKARTEPKGIQIHPCRSKQKAEWWVRAHNFKDPHSLPANEIQELKKLDLSTLIGPSFSVLLCFFYFLIGNNVNSVYSQILLSFISILHISSLCLLDADNFYFTYYDCFSIFFTYLGSHLEAMFDAFNYTVNKMSYVVKGFIPPPYCTQLYTVLMQKMGKFWPRLLHKPLLTLRKLSMKTIKNLLKAIYLIGFYYPKLSTSVSKMQIHHINLKGIPTQRTKHIFPNPLFQGIPIFFEKGLPFVSANINGTFVKFLIDTGSAHNIINKNVINQLTKNCVEIPKFQHNLQLCGHSGQLLAIDEYAVKIPVRFLNHDSLPSSKTIDLPFLVEENESAVSILGMTSLRKLNISSSKGFKHLFLALKEDLSPIGSPSQGTSYRGTVSQSCNENQDPCLDIRFPDLASYTGCVILQNCNQNHTNILDKFNGMIYHVKCGLAKINSPLPVWSLNFKDFSLSGAPISCSHSDPEGGEALASLLHPPVGDPDHAAERQHDLEQDSNLFDEVIRNHNLNIVDPDPNPDPILSPSHDWDITNNFNLNITVPGKTISKNTNVADPNQHPDPTLSPMQELETSNYQDTDTEVQKNPTMNPISPEYLEIQVRDYNGTCYLCVSDLCSCNIENNKDKLCKKCTFCACSHNPALEKNLANLKKNYPKIIKNQGLITFFVFHPDDIYKNIFSLSNFIINAMRVKSYQEVKLGNTLGSIYGTEIFARLSRSLSVSQSNCPGIPITLIPTAKETVIHALEFDVEKGQLIHRPMMMNDVTGIEEELLQPPEINYIMDDDEYSQDLSEVINNSNPTFSKFLQETFQTYNKSYIKSPTDYGELELETFRMDLDLLADSEHLLPRHKPFGASAHITKIVDKITRFWTDIDLARPSEITSHASRLLVVTKKVSQRSFEKMKSEIEANTEYRFRTDNPSELYSVDPDFLTVKQINSVFRICLDSRDLNRISKDMVQRSQNPETTIYNLMLSLGGADASATKKYTWEDFRNTDPFKNSHFSTPDPDLSFIEKLTKSENLAENKDYYYSTLDISSAHTSVPLTERAKFLLNFITPSMKILQFQRAVFGLKNISSAFNGSLCRILEDLITLGFVHVYADDVILIAKHKQTHLALIAEIARRFNKHGLKISLTKSNFGIDKFTYLGFTFDQSGISLSQDRIDSLTNFPTPKDIKGVQRFLGALNYIQRFIPQYSFNLFPITLLLSEKEFFWNSEQEEAFKKIKWQLNQKLLLHYVPARTQLHLFVDASLVAGGGVLFCGQPGTDSYKPILYMSKKFSAHEIRKHSALESEMHNLIYCLEKCSYFFTSLDRPVQVHTDAKTVMYLIFGARKTSNPKLARLALKLSGYLVHFNLNYTPPNCPEMKIADCLSRQYYHLIPKLPGDLVKVIKKEDILIPDPGIYNFEQLDEWVENNKVINQDNYPEKIIKIHQIEEKNSEKNPEHFSLIHLIDWDKLGEFQRKDPLVAEIFKDFSPKELFEGTPKNGYLVRNNLLYAENKSDPLFPKIVIPDPLLPTVVAGAHIGFNHVGAYKHFELLKTLIHNPNLKKVVFDLISKCHLCAVVNCDTNRKGIITNVRFPDSPGQTFSIDFMTVAKDHGHDSILVIMDLFSNFCVLEPCKNQSTEAAINALSKAFHYIGSPREIRADGQQSLLKATQMKKFLKKHRVRPEIYPPYYKYHNAACERQIRNIRSIFRTQNSLDSNFKWFKNLDNTMTVLNAIPRKFRHGGVTRFLSPFEIFFGRKRQMLKIDSFDEFPLANAQPGSLMASPLRNFTRGAMLALKNDYRQMHNEKARSNVIKPGDFYLVQNNKTPQAGRIALKYQPRFLPNIFLCKQVSGRNVLGLDIIMGNANYSSIDHVKVYRAREEYFSDLPETVKKHFGSSLDLKLSLDARKVILEKLQKLGMYQDILRPAETLSSPAFNSSSASATVALAMMHKSKHSLSENKASSQQEQHVDLNRETRPHASQPVERGQGNYENLYPRVEMPSVIARKQDSPAKIASQKEMILKKLGRAKNYLRPFLTPPKKRQRKQPDWFKP